MPFREVCIVGEFFWLFLSYGFLGFCLEILFARVTGSSKPDRKCHLVLPVCPVYGLGALGILLLPGWVKASPLLLCLAGGAVATAAEWGMSLFYEKAAGVAFWDYHGLPLNLNGRVCLPFALAWGFLAVPMVYRLHPALLRWVRTIPPTLALPAALFYLADAGLSLAVLRARGTEGLRWYQKITPFGAR